MGSPLRELRNVGRVRSSPVLEREEELRKELEDRTGAMVGGEEVSEAGEVGYDSTTSGLAATNVQEALDELQASGSWTPDLQFGGSTTGISYSARDGHYYQLGAVVIVTGTIELSSKGTATGNATLAGLPAAAADNLAGTGIEGGGVAQVAANLTGSNGGISMTVVGSDLVLYEDDGAGGGSAQLTDATFTNTTVLRFFAVYFA